MHRLPLEICQARLATVWVVGLAVCLIVLMGQTMGGRYGIEYRKAWEWWIPQIFPTLGVIVGGVAYGIGHRERSMEVATAPYRLAMWLSGLYLVTLVATLVLVGFVPAPGVHGPISATQTGDNTWLDVSKVWFTPFNGLVTALLGAFFASSQPTPKAAPAGHGSPAGETKPAVTGDAFVPHQWKSGEPQEGRA